LGPAICRSLKFLIDQAAFDEHLAAFVSCRLESLGSSDVGHHLSWEQRRGNLSPTETRCHRHGRKFEPRHFAATDSFQAQGSSRRNVRRSSRSAEVRMKVKAAVYRHVTT
jgi:hypothetical protein